MGVLGNASRAAHGSALQASRVVYDARCKLAALFGCKRADHTIFTCSATEALNIALQGLLAPGDHVVTTDLEHNSVLRPLYRQQADVSFVAADGLGNIDDADFEKLLRPETRAIVCTHASNLTGTVLDIARIGALAHAHNVLFLVDASQTAGVLPIDMEAMHIDVLCFTGHKGLMGPQGTGGLCIREGVEIRPWKVGGSGVQSFRKEQPSEYPVRLEAGTLNAHGIAGLSAAVDYIQSIGGVQAVQERENALARRFYEGVSTVDGVTVYGSFAAPVRTAVVALNIWDYDSGAVSDALSEDYDIATRPGAHCAPRIHQALGTQTQGAVRFSFSWFNTEEEVDAAIEAVGKLAQK